MPWIVLSILHSWWTYIHPTEPASLQLSREGFPNPLPTHHRIFLRSKVMFLIKIDLACNPIWITRRCFPFWTFPYWLWSGDWEEIIQSHFFGLGEIIFLAYNLVRIMKRLYLAIHTISDCAGGQQVVGVELKVWIWPSLLIRMMTNTSELNLTLYLAAILNKLCLRRRFCWLSVRGGFVWLWSTLDSRSSIPMSF